MKEAFIRQIIGSKEIYNFLSDLVSQQLKSVIIIEHKDDMVVEACEGLKVPPRILEFKTFEREDSPNVRAYLLEPLYEYGRPLEKVGEGERKFPPHRLSWEKRLEWINPSVKSLVTQLTSKIEKELPDVTHLPKYRWYYFYKGKSQDMDSLFTVLILTKKSIKVRIRTDPKEFKDSKNWTKAYKGWFFKKGEEREFTISRSEQLPYAMELIKQPYELAK